MAKGYVFKDWAGIFCEYHSQSRILEDPELLEKVVKISKKDLADCPGCQDAIRQGCGDWTRIL